MDKINLPTNPKVISAKINIDGFKPCEACGERKHIYLFEVEDNRHTVATLCDACALAYTDDAELIDILNLYMYLMNDSRDDHLSEMEWPGRSSVVVKGDD